jgi:hypothetical protein
VSREPGRTTKRRALSAITGMSPGHSYCAYNNTIDGMERAVKERLFYISENGKFSFPPLPRAGVFDRVVEEFEKVMKRRAVYVKPMDMLDFSNVFSGHKKQRYLLATKALQIEGIRERDANTKYFMKFETTNWTEKPDPPPRGINPRSDKYLVALGIYIRPIEKLIYKAVEETFGYKVVLKGMNHKERGEIISQYWSEFRKPVAVAMDASRFEQSVSQDVLKFESRVYSAYFPGDKHFLKLMRWQLETKGRARAPDGKLSFTVTGMRMSGDPNTSSGNCVGNSAMQFSFVKFLGITKHRVFLDGDDSVIIIENDDLAKVQKYAKQYFLNLGFRMKVEEPAHILEKIVFCGSSPINVDGHYVMVRNPSKSLSKDVMSKTSLLSKTTFHRWCAAVGQGGCSLNSGIPIQHAFYSSLARAGTGYVPFKMDEYSPLSCRGKSTPVVSGSTRYSYFKAFGISPDAQVDLENYYKSFDLHYDGAHEYLRGPALWEYLP